MLHLPEGEQLKQYLYEMRFVKTTQGSTHPKVCHKHCIKLKWRWFWSLETTLCSTRLKVCTYYFYKRETTLILITRNDAVQYPPNIVELSNDADFIQ